MEKKLIAGVSLGLGGIEAVLTDADFTVLEELSRPLNPKLGKESIASKVEKAARSLARFHQVRAVGVAVPATFAPDGLPAGRQGKKIATSTIHELEGANLYQLLAKKIEVPIFILRRNFCALLAEQAFGAAKSAKNAVLVEIGLDVGCSFLVGGKIYRGANNAAGQIAEVIVDITREKRNNDGEFGELISGTGIEAIAGKSVYQILKDSPREGVVTKQILRDLKESLLTGLYNVKLLFDPEMFIISGDIVENFNLFRSSFADLGVRVLKSELGKSAAALGAAIAAYNQAK